MNICFQFGNGVCPLPEKIKAHFKAASGTYYKVLAFFAAEPSFCTDCQSNYKKVAALTGVPADEVSSAVTYWIAAGVLAEHSEDMETTTTGQMDITEKTAEKRPKKPDFPTYSDGEVATLMDKNLQIKPLVDECQKIVGKMFSAYEISVVVALYDYLGLRADYIMTLFAYCKRKGKTSMRYIERMAAGLLDKGIDNVQALEEKITAMEKADSAGGLVRRLFGMGQRALTSTEKKEIDCWVNQWMMSPEMIEYAYELMIGNIDKPSMKYANKIMENWHEKNLKTIEDVQQAQALFKQNGATPKKGGKEPPRRLGEFDVDEFLSLALQRSME